MAENKVRVLIVDDVAETRENIRKLLQFDNDIEVVGAVNSGRAGIESSKELKPDVVIMDINMPDMDGIIATENIRRSNPFTQIVILSVQGDPNYMRRAMLAGARDFLTKPPAVDELISAIRRAGKMAQDERAKAASVAPVGPGFHKGTTGMLPPLGRVILVYSPKGGTGSTTLAVNLAVTLHNEETPLALVDGNLQFGDVAVFLNTQGRNSILDLAPRADELDPEIIEEVMITHSASGIKVLAAPVRPEYSETVSGEQFAKIIQYLRQIYSYVVIDSSSTLTDVILSAIDISDLIILITTQDIPAVKCARQFLDLAQSLKIDRQKILFVMNRYDRRINILPERISESFKHPIVAVIPMDERVVIPSVNRGVPFMLEDRSRPIAQAYLSLAKVVRQKVTEVASTLEGATTMIKK